MTPEQQIAELMKSDPAAVTRMIHASHAKKVRDHYAPHLKDDDESPLATLTVKNWSGIKLLLAEVPDADHNTGGPAFQPLLDDVKAAIAAKDADRLFLNLLLIYKAVGRS